MKTQLFGRILGVAIAAAGAFTATSASAQTRIDLDENLLNFFNDTYVQDETAFLSDAEQFQVDLNDIVYTGYGEGKNLDIFLVNEGAGFHNSLTLNGVGGGIEVFDDISAEDSQFQRSNDTFAMELGEGLRFNQNDLTPEITLGSAFEFLLHTPEDDISGNGGYTFSTTGTDNPDGLQHAVGYNYTDGEGTDWLILGFEDLYGPQSGVSDRDFNDVVFAVRGASAQDVPEPGMMLGIVGVAAGLLKLRKKNEQ